jgi:hypothetical protein
VVSCWILSVVSERVIFDFFMLCCCNSKISTLRYTSLHSATLRYTSLHFATLRYTSLHFATLRYTSLHFATLRYTDYIIHILLHYRITEIEYICAHTYSILQTKLYTHTNIDEYTITEELPLFQSRPQHLHKIPATCPLDLWFTHTQYR